MLLALTSVQAIAGEYEPPTEEPAPLESPTWQDFAYMEGLNSDGEAVELEILPTRYALDVPPAKEDGPTPTQVGSELRGRIDDALGGGPNEVVDVLAWVRDDEEKLADVSPQAAAFAAVASGAIPDEQEARRAVKRSALLERQQVVQELVDQVLVELDTDGVTDLERFRHLPAVAFRATLLDLGAIVNTGVLDSVHLEHKQTEDWDGEEIAVELPMTPFYDHNGDGVDRAFGDFDGSGYEGLAQLEGRLPSTEPLSFNDDAGTSRVTFRWDCSRRGGCVPADHRSTTSAHATTVMSTAISDISLGQDPYYTVDRDIQRRSAVARGARTVAFQSTGGRGVLRAIDEIVDAVGTPAELGITCRANSNATSPCDPTGALERAHDVLFEDGGVLAFNSAGNHGDGDPSTCDLSSPGASPAVVAVNQYSQWYDRRLRGPRSGDGARSMVSIASVDRYDFAADPAPSGYHGATGTSIATPAVAAAVAVYSEAWLSTFHTYAIRSPGVLKAHILMMGDYENGGVAGNAHPLVRGFDPEWGAGRLQLRTWTPGDFRGTGGQVFIGAVCLEHGEALVVETPWRSDERVVSAVAWWLDRRIERGHTSNNVDLSVVVHTDDFPFPLPWDPDYTVPVYDELMVDGDTVEERERVLVERASLAPDALRYGVKLRGLDIRGTDPVCGRHAEHVYFGIRVEGP